MAAVTATSNPTFAWNAESGRWGDMKTFKDPTLLGPAIVFALITPTNTTALAKGPTRGLWVGAAGIIFGQDAFGNQVNGIPVAIGWNPLCMAGIDATSTTATNIWGVW
jgi:hypothetical protein